MEDLLTDVAGVGDGLLQERVEGLTTEPHFLTYLQFLAGVYQGCGDRSLYMQAWFNEVDSFPFEYTLNMVLRGQQPSADDSAEALTRGATFEASERQFEARRKNYAVVSVEDLGVIGGTSKDIRSSSSSKEGWKGASSSGGGDVHVLYRFIIMRGDGE